MFKNLFFVMSLFIVCDLSAKDSQFYSNNLLSDNACQQCNDIVCNNSYDRECKKDGSVFYNNDSEIRDICFDINGRDLKIKKIYLKGNKLYISFDDDFSIACTEEGRSFFKTLCKSIFNISYTVLEYSVSVVRFSCDHPVFAAFCGYLLYNFLPETLQGLVRTGLSRGVICFKDFLVDILRRSLSDLYRGAVWGVRGSFSSILPSGLRSMFSPSVMN